MLDQGRKAMQDKQEKEKEALAQGADKADG